VTRKITKTMNEKNDSHFGASMKGTPNTFTDREEQREAQGRGLRRYLTTKNEGHFTSVRRCRLTVSNPC